MRHAPGRSDPEADVVVIGAGPTGAAAALGLAEAGLSVLCLEQGDWLDEAGLGRNETDWPLRKGRDFSANPNRRGRPEDDPVDDADSPVRPMFWNGVGGSSVLWSAHVPRFTPGDFRVASEDGVGLDWPIDYAALEPWYERAERLMGAAIRPGDPLAQPRSGRWPEPLPYGSAALRMEAALGRLGWHCWPVDRSLGDQADGHACHHDGPCDWACATGRRAAADRTLWPRALASGARLATRAKVLGLEQGAANQVSAALYRDASGITRRARASAFVVAANALGTARLLLLSASKRQPSGLANRSGQVGRNLMLHPYAAAVARFDERFGSDPGGPTSGLVCHEFYRTDRTRGFVRGCKLQLFSRNLPAGIVLDAPPEHCAGFTVCADDLPEPGNRIVLSDRLRDSAGLPAARIVYRLSANARRILDFGLDRAEEALREAGSAETSRIEFRADTGFHLMGTARMGIDPDASVVDPFGRAHDVGNLWVADASVFVTGSAMNPTNTAVALALRLADRLVETAREQR